MADRLLLIADEGFLPGHRVPLRSPHTVYITCPPPPTKTGSMNITAYFVEFKKVPENLAVDSENSLPRRGVSTLFSTSGAKLLEGVQV